MGDHTALAGMVVKAGVHLSVVSIGHEGRQPEPGGMGTLLKPAYTANAPRVSPCYRDSRSRGTTTSQASERSLCLYSSSFVSFAQRRNMP